MDITRRLQHELAQLSTLDPFGEDALRMAPPGRDPQSRQALELAEALRRGGFQADFDVVQRLVQRARTQGVRFDPRTFAREFARAPRYRQTRADSTTRLAVVRGIPVLYRPGGPQGRHIVLVGVLPPRTHPHLAAEPVGESPNSYVQSGIESAMLRSAVRSGMTDENQLANLIFFRRHPERNGLLISRSEPNFQQLSQEWLGIRDTLVRSILRGTTPGQPVPSAPTVPSPSAGGGTGAPDIVMVRGIPVARKIAPRIEDLLAAAEADGVKLGSASGFRTYEDQIRLRKQFCGTSDWDIYEKPSSECNPPTARPGTSRHEQGLAIDFTYNGAKINSSDNPGFRWLAANAERFGLRNLLTEPWHWSVDGK